MRGTARSAFERESLIAACRASGLSPKAFAQRESLPPSTLYQWLAKATPPRRAVRIVRVVRRAPASLETAAPASAAPPLMVELGAARVRVNTGFDRNLLAEVLDVLEPRCRKDPS
jgi:predicted transcriptional regulator